MSCSALIGLGTIGDAQHPEPCRPEWCSDLRCLFSARRVEGIERLLRALMHRSNGTQPILLCDLLGDASSDRPQRSTRVKVKPVRSGFHSQLMPEFCQIHRNGTVLPFVVEIDEDGRSGCAISSLKNALYVHLRIDR